MKRSISVRSRAHRTLGRLSSFTTDLSAIGSALDRLALNTNEEIIGAYRNSETSAIVVTSFALHIVSADVTTRIPFKSIVKMEAPTSKTNGEEVVLWLSAGDRTVVQIRGGRGQFKDVFEFGRFLARVLGDQPQQSAKADG